jgi:competence protein ComGC
MWPAEIGFMQPQSSGSAFYCRKMRQLRARCGNSTRGMTLVELLCVIVVVIILLGVIMPPGHDRNKAIGITCLVYLKNVGLAYRTWASDNNDLFPFQVSTNQQGTLELTNDIAAQFRVLSNELATPKIAICPGLYSKIPEATNWTELSAKNVGYYVNIGADSKITNSILSGDPGFTIDNFPPTSGINRIRRHAQIRYPKDVHAGFANVVKADGSAMRVKNENWPFLLGPSSPTNLFLLP